MDLVDDIVLLRLDFIFFEKLDTVMSLFSGFLCGLCDLSFEC